MYSSLAYQGSTGLSLNWIQEINRYALKPDFALFIDVEPSTVLERIKRKKSIMENFQTQQKVREVYLHFVKAGELIKIDGNKSRKAVAKEVLDRVLASLRKVS
jgi:dTMP kinase